MTTCRLLLGARFLFPALISLAACCSVEANTVLQDKGIFVAGPFPVPDIHQLPSASAEAVFVAGSVANAPLYLNELLVDGAAPQGEFTNNGWVNGSAFQVNMINNGSSVWISWDLTATKYALTYISVNFDNALYHVYGTNPLTKSDGAVLVTGNDRDVISHINFFGVSTVPDNGSSAWMLCGTLGLMFVLRKSATRRGIATLSS